MRKSNVDQIFKSIGSLFSDSAKSEKEKEIELKDFEFKKFIGTHTYRYWKKPTSTPKTSYTYAELEIGEIYLVRLTADGSFWEMILMRKDVILQKNTLDIVKK